MKKTEKRAIQKTELWKKMVIFSVFVIFMFITICSNYEYNTVVTARKVYEKSNDISEELLNNISEIYTEYKNNGSSIKLSLFYATLIVTESYSGISDDDITIRDIHTIFKCMNDEFDIEDFAPIYYDEESFRKNIKEHWFSDKKFKKTLGKSSKHRQDEVLDDIYKQLDVYNQLYGEEEDDSHSSTSGGGVCNYKVGDKNYSNVKVKLLNCEGNSYVSGEETYDLEYYVTGVIAQEIGETDLEAMKVQAIVARSFSLKRPSVMGGAYGVKLEQSGSDTVLSLRSCTNDQVFCNPDKGCWSNRRGGQTSNSNPSDWKNCTVHSGYDNSKTWTKKALSADSKIRTAVQETSGQVAVDSSGNIVYTDFTDTNQQYWKKLAKEGKDYFEILKKDYPKVATVKSDCSSGESTELGKEALSWKQYDSRWGSELIGTKTIKQVGCMVTATSIQIARSGTELKTKDFNPGVFVKTVKKNHGFSGNNFNVDDSTWSEIAPNFKTGGVVEFKATEGKKSKINKIAELISQGYYVIARIYHPGQHWVALTGVNNGKVTMADPGSTATDFCGKYSCGATFTKITYFKAK